MLKGRAGVYKKVRVNGMLVFEHRFIAEQMIGKKLTSKEFVHHKDGDKTNNNPENLEIVSIKTHGLKHSLLRNLIIKINKPNLIN